VCRGGLVPVCACLCVCVESTIGLVGVLCEECDLRVGVRCEGRKLSGVV